jgi:hypothetical protein
MNSDLGTTASDALATTIRAAIAEALTEQKRDFIAIIRAVEKSNYDAYYFGDSEDSQTLIPLLISKAFGELAAGLDRPRETD